MKKSLGFLGSLAVCAVAWSTVQAAAPTAEVETGARAVPMWNTGLSLVPGNCGPGTNSGFGGPPGPIESTGFEAADGWESGFQICGSYYDDADCIEPQVVTACTPPGPDENCCGDFPNVNNCWFTSSASRSCNEPGISSLNAFAGANHLRMQAQLGIGGSHQCFTPIQAVDTPGQTHIEFMLNGSGGAGNELHFRVFDDNAAGASGAFAAYMYFDTTGGTNNMYIYDWNNPSATRKVFVGYWVPGVYNKVEIDINPCRETGFTQVYKYNGGVIYSHSTAAFPASVERANWLLVPNAGDKTWDIDDYIITRGTACAPAVCGDGFVDAPETCEPGLAGSCPTGRCIAVGDPGECTCRRICTLSEPCILNKGSNGPYVAPFDAAYGGIFLFDSDAGATSINTCGSDYDTRILYWGSACCPDPGSSNDDCDTSTCCGAGSDPSASCYVAGDIAPPYPSCTCWDLPDPLDTVFIAQLNAGPSLMINITNKTECGLPIPGGACCDGETGLCTDGASVTLTSCTAISGQAVFTANKTCDLVSCVEHTGACCDNSVKATHCTPGTDQEDDCAGANQTWVKGVSCDPNPCPALTLGACCTLLDGFCQDDLTQAECDAKGAVLQPRFSLDKSCANLDPPCSAELGACCDHDTFGGCLETVFADCQGGKLEWTKGASCANIACLHEGIPTVSTWGLAVLTLLLLVGAKVYFGRRQNATA
jgi:hypothetical protein